MIDFYEEHREHRHLFEIIAFHNASVKSFAELDAKLVDTRANLWRGRDLPFPTLLDDTGTTFKAYGIYWYPTSLLIDPEGKIVAKGAGFEGAESQLEKHLPAVPKAERVHRALDRYAGVAFDGDTTLEQACQLLTRLTGLKVRLRQADLERLHLKPDTVIPLEGSPPTLRACLDVMLDPFGLTYETDATGLVIVARDPKAIRQTSEVERVMAD